MLSIREKEYGSFKIRLIQCIIVLGVLFIIYGYNASQGYIEPCELHDLGHDPSVDLIINEVD